LKLGSGPNVNDWICSHHHAGDKGIAQNQIFSFDYMLLFLPLSPNLQHGFNGIGSYTITNISNVISLIP
jgi:hypothetical protein